MQSLNTVAELFDAAAALEPAAWEGFVTEACAGNGAQAAEVLALLRAQAEAFGWFDHLERDLKRLGPPPPASKSAGQHIGPYHLLRELGRGGMGTVFLAADPTGQPVALKRIALHRYSAGLLRRFEAECDIHARLAHPGVARLLDAGEDESGAPFLVMEYVDGLPITVHAARHGRAVPLFLEACAAVEHLHEQRIIHCDLKPSNILVDGGGPVKLVDFGIAHRLGDDQSPWAPLTPEYAAPEQWTGGPITTATDVYALGRVLRDLFPKEPWSAPVCERAMAREPRERHASVALLMLDVTGRATHPR